jgi:hypothetical protein
MRATTALARSSLDESILIGLAGLLVVVGLTLGGDTQLAYLAVGVPLVVGLAWWRPAYGMALLIGTVLLSEEYEITTLAGRIEPFILPIFNSIESYTPLPLPLNAIELCVLLLGATWVAQGIAARQLQFRPIPCAAAWAGAAAAILLTFAAGVATGGDRSTAIVEIRALVYFFGLAWLVPQLVQQRRDFAVIAGVMIAALGAKALQGLYRYVVVLGMDLDLTETFLAHEDPVMFVPLLFLAIALWHHGGPRILRWSLAVAGPLMLAALVLTQRRVAYVTLGICAVYFALVLAGPARRAYLRLALPVVVIGALYVASFTGASGPLARPIERAWSLVDDANTSNRYRIVELQNLRHTIHVHPWGIGFGHPYEMLQPLPESPFELYEYIPHNEVLWVWVKAGTLGFILVMFYFARLVGESVWIYRRARDPLLRAVAVVVGLAIVNQLVASYFELQLTYARNMVYLGTLVGLLAPIRRWSGLAPDRIGWRL